MIDSSEGRLYRRNSKGPKLEPCSMPHLTVLSLDVI